MLNIYRYLTNGVEYKKTLKLTAIILALVMFLATFSGCAYVKHSAILYDDAQDWINPAFPHVDGDKTFIIDTKEKYDEAFVAGVDELEIDFDKEMIVIYSFTASNGNGYYLWDINVNDGVLCVKYRENPKFKISGDFCRPFRRWFVVKLNARDITSAEFEEVFWNIGGAHI